MGVPFLALTILIGSGIVGSRTTHDRGLMHYCVDEKEPAENKPGMVEEHYSPPAHVGFQYKEYFNSAVRRREWMEFINGTIANGGKRIGPNMKEDDPPDIPEKFGEVGNLSLNYKNQHKTQQFAFSGFYDGEGGTTMRGVYINFFILPEMFPWIKLSKTALESFPETIETIDTIWPLNLIGRTFECLISRLYSDPNARMRELIYEDFQSGPPGFDTQADPTKKRRDDKPSHISPERIHGAIQ
jgi:hypothetical protein